MGLYTGSRSRGQRERTNPVIFPLPLGKSSVQKPRCPRETYLPRAVRCACPRKDTATGFQHSTFPRTVLAPSFLPQLLILVPVSSPGHESQLSRNGTFTTVVLASLLPNIGLQKEGVFSLDPILCCYKYPPAPMPPGRLFSLLSFFSTQHHLPIHSLKPFILAISFLAVQSTPVQPLL